MNYKQYYDLENYLFSIVIKKFLKYGYLNAHDFFCIVIWKANRAKTKIMKKMLSIANVNDINFACKKLTTAIMKTITSPNRG